MPSQIEQKLSSVSLWLPRDSAISRTFKCETFLLAIEFVNQVAQEAEKANHHPDIDIRWNKVTLTLTTHDKGGLTEKDFLLARQCDALFSKLV